VERREFNWGGELKIRIPQSKKVQQINPVLDVL
jgi:hypothetical protein